MMTKDVEKPQEILGTNMTWEREKDVYREEYMNCGTEWKVKFSFQRYERPARLECMMNFKT